MKNNNHQTFAFVIPSLAVLWGVVGLFSVFVLYIYSDWIFSGGMWAESATNYFALSRSDSFYQRIFGTDAGYIPLPQRVIALIFAVIDFPVSSIPLAYFASATLGSATLVGIFTLPRFRALVSSDVLRFLISATIFLFADFELRQFINFTLFSLFFVLVVSVLSLTERQRDLPWWAWLVPMFMISKPHLLTALPLLLICIFWCKSNYRLISILALVAAVIQLVQMSVSHASGHFVPTNSYSLIDRALAAVYYFISLIGVYIVGPGRFLSWIPAFISGIVFVSLCIFSLKMATVAIRWLMLCAFAVGLANAMMNAFLLSDSWNVGLERLFDAFSHRQAFIQFASTIVLIGCLLEIVGLRFIKSVATRNLTQIVLFLSWFFFAGWANFFVALNTLPGSPTIGNSYWMSGAADISKKSHVCVPIDPIGWSYGPGCHQLNSEISWGRQYFFDGSPNYSEKNFISYSPPIFRNDAKLSAVSILLRSKLDDEIDVCLIVIRKNFDRARSCKKFSSSSAGKLITFVPDYFVNYTDVQAMEFVFSSVIDLAYVKQVDKETPAILVYILPSER